MIDSYNATMATVGTFLTFVFGADWYLFAMFLFLNIADWITGWMKARINKTENSIIGAKGILKKLGYWIMIAVAFMLSNGFVELGTIINVDLGITSLLGWFVLTALCVNEARSIVENFVEAGFHVPNVLVKGLEVANRAVNKKR